MLQGKQSNTEQKYKMVLREKEREDRQERQKELLVVVTHRLLRQSPVPVPGCVGGAADCPQLPLTGEDLLPQHSNLLQLTVW